MILVEIGRNEKSEMVARGRNGVINWEKKSWIRDSNKKTERETIKEKHGIGENIGGGVKPLGKCGKREN